MAPLAGELPSEAQPLLTSQPPSPSNGQGSAALSFAGQSSGLAAAAADADKAAPAPPSADAPPTAYLNPGSIRAPTTDFSAMHFPTPTHAYPPQYYQMTPAGLVPVVVMMPAAGDGTCGVQLALFIGGWFIHICWWVGALMYFCSDTKQYNKRERGAWIANVTMTCLSLLAIIVLIAVGALDKGGN